MNLLFITLFFSVATFAFAQDFYYVKNSGTCINSGYVDITDCTACDVAVTVLDNNGIIASVNGVCGAVSIPDFPFWNNAVSSYPTGSVIPGGSGSGGGSSGGGLGSDPTYACALNTANNFVGVLTGGTGSCSAANRCICADPNECTLGTHNCDANAACTNTAGGFNCACNAGYSGDGTTCTAISCAGDCTCIKNKIIASDYTECPS